MRVFAVLLLFGIVGILTMPNDLGRAALSQEEFPDWEEDINSFVERLRLIHPDPFSAISEEDFDLAVEEALDRLPSLTNEQAVLEIMTLVALVNDGHTWMLPQQDAFGYRMLPIRIYQFSDGFFVTDASEGFEYLVGARLSHIGDVPIDEVVQALSSLVSRDNEFTLRERLPQYILTPEILLAAGIAESPDVVELVVQDSDMSERHVEIEPISMDAYFDLIEPAPTFSQFFPMMLPEDENALYLSDLESNFWSREMPETQSIYVQYNAVQSVSVDETGTRTTLNTFRNQLSELLDSGAYRRIVVDLRHNLGGDIGTFGPLLNLLMDHESLQDPGSVVLLIGRRTFSAAGVFTDRVRASEAVMLVGEPSGSGLNFFADNQRLTLPNSRIAIDISTRAFNTVREDDRPWHEPDVWIELTSEDYFAGRDPALEAAINLD